MSLKPFSYSDKLKLDEKSIEKVFSKNQRFHSKGLFFLFRKNKVKHARIVFILSKKKARRANLRNRIKRHGREFIRLNSSNIKPVDIVVLPNKALKEASKSDIRECYQNLLNYLKK